MAIQTTNMFSASTTFALPTALPEADVADNRPPQYGYGYDGPPLDSNFCRNAGSKENECRKDVVNCDKKFDDQGQETQCAKNIKKKYSPYYYDQPKYGYDGPPLDSGFCRNAGSKENECKKEVQKCDQKYDNQGRENQCVKDLKKKYYPNGYDPKYQPKYDPKYGYDGPPLDSSFCRNAGSKENECRNAVQKCDQKYDNQGHESSCVKAVKDKYVNHKVYKRHGPNGHSAYTAPTFCNNLGNLASECKLAAQACDQKFDNPERTKTCMKEVREKYIDRHGQSYNNPKGYNPPGYKPPKHGGKGGN
ncbi:hypothetical protein FKW77_001159 [Venturia effusa]|uniref:Uncharacterized protein n=1 Tax=Venturia effusa TaxID=50376 RepID=A0A517LJL0_9PEZI|nr:hypothetical protein FKW77_001159 [Venturia effusa]